MLNSNTTILVVILTSLGTLLPLSTNKAFINEVDAEEPQQLSTSMLHDIITVQNTSMSVPAPNARANNQSVPHQIVVALPASKPIEVEVEHKYDPKVIPDIRHGAPLIGKWIDNTTRIALSPMTIFSNTPVTITNTPISTGSFIFAGSALVFHKTDGQQFTVTYTLDATAKPLTPK